MNSIYEALGVGYVIVVTAVSSAGLLVLIVYGAIYLQRLISAGLKAEKTERDFERIVRS